MIEDGTENDCYKARKFMILI